jgi:hypothetical protein
MFEGPIIEVHISNIHRRDEHHRHSMTSTAATGVICGLGPQGYIAAIDAVAAMPNDCFAKVARLNDEKRSRARCGGETLSGCKRQNGDLQN